MAVRHHRSPRRRQAKPQEVSNHTDHIFIRRRITSRSRYSRAQSRRNRRKWGSEWLACSAQGYLGRQSDSDCTREGSIVALLHAVANDEDKELVGKHLLTTICHGDAWKELDILDDTANALMRGLNITPSRDSVFGLQRTPFIQNYILTILCVGIASKIYTQDIIPDRFQ